MNIMHKKSKWNHSISGFTINSIMAPINWLINSPEIVINFHQFENMIDMEDKFQLYWNWKKWGIGPLIYWIEAPIDWTCVNQPLWCFLGLVMDLLWLLQFSEPLPSLFQYLFYKVIKLIHLVSKIFFTGEKKLNTLY